jgi:hypothetical protein
MALFGSSRDISFIKKVNGELLDNVIQQEVDYYKYFLPETKAKDTSTNLYGEASGQKTYYPAVRVTCLMEAQDQMYVADDQFGVDVTQAITFRFFKPKLRDIGLVPVGGDIIEIHGNYYEIDQIIENQYVVGKDNDYGKSVGSNFGESLSMLCVTHMTRVSRLQLVKTRV